MDDWVVRTTGLTRRFGAVTAVDDVHLSVARGEVYGFLGRNGAGKTTVIRLLLGLIRPSAGEVDILGARVTDRNERRRSAWRRVGYLVEAPGLYPDLTVGDHLRLTGRYRRIERAILRDTVTALGLERELATRVRALSSGNRQRLGLALALAHRPDLLILDEPVNALDPSGVVEVRALLRRLADDGVTVFLSSHLLSEVARLADRVGIIHRGRLVEDLSTQALHAATRPRLALRWRDPHLAAEARAALASRGIDVDAGFDAVTAYGRDIDHAAAERVVTALVDAGTPPCSMTVECEDLESLFLRVTREADASRAGGR